MNIFQYFGLPEGHRKPAKTTQLVKHWDEVTDKHKAGKNFLVQVKKDGVCAIVLVRGGDVSIWSRTGKAFTNVGRLKSNIRKYDLPDGVYLGELTCASISLEVLSGIVNPNRVNPIDFWYLNLLDCFEFNVFDRVSIHDFMIGSRLTGYFDRYCRLRADIIPDPFSDGNRLTGINLLYNHPAASLEEIEGILSHFVLSGEEGIVIRDPDAGWEAGHKGYRVMKMVRGVDYDLQCIGYEEGSGKYTGKIANLIFGWKDGLTIKCMLGKGYTHAMAAQMFDEIDTDKSVVGAIFQVYALEESSKGKLRLPKVGELRHDKGESDV